MKSLNERFPRIYTMLKSEGHDAAKAIEIMLDATRGDKHSLKWIGALFSLRHI